jgi:hypothetical protein
MGGDMSNAEPPRLSGWLLERLASPRGRESMVGDLHEQFRRGRSRWWYRRQVAGTILVGLTSDFSAHKLLGLGALAIGWSATLLAFQFVFPLMEQTRRAVFRNWGPSLWGDSEIMRQLWVYYGLPFVLATCLIFIAIGWMTARLQRRLVPGIVIVLSATLLIPAAFNGLQIWHMLQTDLWPGWGWGSFRWALVFQAFLAFVVYPLCVLGGGLWEPARGAKAN